MPARTFSKVHAAHNEVHAGHNKVQAAHNEVHAAHNKVHAAHNKVYAAHNKVHAAHIHVPQRPEKLQTASAIIPRKGKFSIFTKSKEDVRQLLISRTFKWGCVYIPQLLFRNKELEFSYEA